MKTIKKNKVIYNFSPENQPVETVELGEDFWVETEDCYGGQIQSEKDLRPNIDASVINLSTGPIKINNVYAGDVICVKIKEIKLASQGVMVVLPGLGPLGDMIKATDTKIIKIQKDYAHFSEKLKLPLTPMIGVMGVAPKSGKISCESPGDHGGNLDTKDVREGNKVYFPVFVDGANLAVGDLHACMGDGELSGTGIEISGKAKLNISKIDDVQIKMPIVETKDSFMIVSSEKNFKKASRKAMEYAVELLQSALDLSFPDAYRLLSAACDLKISQIVNPLITVRVRIPKYVVNKIF